MNTLAVGVVRERGTGATASFREAADGVAGAVLTSRKTVLGDCDVLVVVHAPGEALLGFFV